MDARALAIYQLLVSTFSENACIRESAEAQLLSEALQSGYGPVLSQIALAQDVRPDVRQLAAVVLKLYVKQHWSEGAKGYTPPVASEEDKSAIKGLLPYGLADSNPKVRTAVGMAIAKIASWDWPNAWPGLMEFLVQAVRQYENEDLVGGALRCLSLLCEDIDDNCSPQILQLLSPELLRIVGDAQKFNNGQRCSALLVMRSLIGVLGTMSGVEQRKCRDLITPLVDPWCSTINSILTAPFNAVDAADVALRTEAVRLLQYFVQYFNRTLGPRLAPLLGACWALLAGAALAYDALVVHGVGPDGAPAASGGSLSLEVDEDGDVRGLDSLARQLLELLVTVVGHREHRTALAPHLQQMVAVALTYMQMTQGQAELQLYDAGDFMADTEEGGGIFSCRGCGEDLLYEMVESFGLKALKAALAAISAWWAADPTSLAGPPLAPAERRWRRREAALLAIKALAPCVGEVSGAGTLLAALARPLLADVLAHELAGAGANKGASSGTGTGAGTSAGAGPGTDSGPTACEGEALVAGRALFMAGQLAHLLSAEEAAGYLAAAVAGLAVQQAAPLHVGGCRAVASLSPRVGAQVLAAQQAAVLSALGALAALQEEATLHLALEATAMVIKAYPEGAAGVVGVVAVPVLELWARHVNDPLVSLDALDVLTQLARAPGCLDGMVQYIVPRIAAVLSQPEESHPPLLMEGSLDLARSLVRAAPPATAAEVCAALLPHALHVIATSDSAEALQNASQLVYTLVHVVGAPLVGCPLPPGPPAAGGGDEGVVAALSCAALRLLEPSGGDSRALYAGHVVDAILRRLPHADVAPHGTALVQAVAWKVAVSGSSPTLKSLLLLVTRLLATDPLALAAALGPPAAPPQGGVSGAALEACVKVLLSRGSEDLTGPLAQRRLAAALVRLTELRHTHPYAALQVEGRLLPGRGVSSGVRTRAAAAREGGLQHTRVTASVRAVCLLAGMLAVEEELGHGGRPTRSPHVESHETLAGIAAELAAGAEDDDDDWEGIEEDEGEEEEDDEDEVEDEEWDVIEGAGGLDGQGGVKNSTSGGGIRSDLLDVLARYAEDNEDAGADDDTNDGGLLAAGDEAPMLPLVQVAGGALSALAQQDAAFLHGCVEEMTPPQRRAVEKLLQRAH